MKRLFLEARVKFDVRALLAKLKDRHLRYGLVATVQHLDAIEDAKKILPNSVVGGQVLGCDVSNAIKIKDKVNCYLFIGSGEFHPSEIFHRTGKKVFVANPFNNSIYEFAFDHRREARIKGAYLTYLHAKKVGILVSVKEGQERLKDTKKLKGYVFLFDTLDFSQLENFTGIDVWINTACPRIAYEDYDKFPKAVINIDDLKKFS
ncbi:diphthamide synthesis protein [Candidatus Woesearchaeota archaeon]|nr:diphthamide synthesis protein [Candidatus Woesearchaeota archaeon]